jgi:small subunit ribosomal protein S6
LRPYEVLLILPPDSDEQVVVKVVDRITQTIQGSGGKVDRIDRWGRKRLAYPIDKQQEGYYLLVEFTADPAALRELDRVLSLADEVIRYKVVVRAAA